MLVLEALQEILAALEIQETSARVATEEPVVREAQLAVPAWLRVG
jgi:hypothetical protein